MAPVTTAGLLLEAQRVERAIGWVRWGAAALALLLGPAFPNLSPAGVYALGIAVTLYNVATLRASRRAGSLARHGRVAAAAFSADLLALSAAMLLFSADQYWTTYFIGTLVITGAAFRFGTHGTVAATVVLTAAYLAVAVFRDIVFGFVLEPQRAAFNVSIYVLTAVLVDRVVRDAREARRGREALIGQLERRVAEDAALAQVMRIVASVPFTEDVVPALLRASRAVFRFDRATVFVADEELGEFRARYRLVPDADDELPPPRLRLGEGVLGAAVRSDRALLVPDLLADPRYVPGPIPERHRSVILVPLRVAGRQVAVFTLSRAVPDVFGEDDVRLAETIAGLIAQVLENQRLFEQASEAEALRALDRLKDEFLAAVSHDLRTPLTVVSGALELLAKDSARLDARSARLVDQGMRNVQRLNRNVEELLELAQLQEAKIALDREFVACATLLADAAAAHEPLAAARGQRLLVNCAEGTPPALVDRRRMARVLGNLVENAVRYSPEGSTIELRGERAGEEIRLSVADEGPGIPPAERTRVFDRFYRLSRTGIGTGTGLGLAIARMLVDLHGGRIWIDDAANRGGLFVVAVPYEAAPEPSVALP